MRDRIILWVPTPIGGPMPREQKISCPDPANKVVEQIAELIRREVERRCGPGSTFEERRDAARGAVGEALWLDEDRDLLGLVVDAEEIEVAGKRYRRLEQPSSASYHGWWGDHFVKEALYREQGVHNGPTIKPIELRAGIIERMTPDLARVVGELSADLASRRLERVLRATGIAPPSRAFIAKRSAAIGDEMADTAAKLEAASRAEETLPKDIASASCGLDRMCVRMGETVEDDEGNAIPCTRAEPYERAAPPQKEHHYREAWVGSASVYDREGNELHTWRYAVEASADPTKLADRVAADLAWIMKANPGAQLHCIQDAAKELRAMPEALTRALPANTKPFVVLVDLEHLMGYLENVVDACEREGDPSNWKGWYRSELLSDDRAIDRIWLKLRRLAEKLPGSRTKARTAVAKALSYIKHRRNKMRYASHYAAKLPIGSGATESTCWQMQQRVKLPAQSWEPRGLRGVLATRALTLSERWETAWPSYAATHRREVRAAA